MGLLIVVVSRPISFMLSGHPCYFGSLLLPLSRNVIKLRVSHYDFSKYNSRKDAKTPRNRLLTLRLCVLARKKKLNLMTLPSRGLHDTSEHISLVISNSSKQKHIKFTPQNTNKLAKNNNLLN